MVALGVLLAGGILTLGIVRWIGRGPRAPATPAAGVTLTPPPAAPATTAAITAPTPTPAAATAPPAVAPTATGRPAKTVATAAPPTIAPTTATPVPPTPGPATATPDLAGPGLVSEPDPAVEARREVVTTVGDGGLGDRAAALLNQLYPLVTRAYAENNPELLRPLLDDDAYEGYIQDIKRTNSESEVIVPVYAYNIQPRVLTNGQDGYAINVAVYRYDRDLDAKTRQVVRVSKPFRACARWYLIGVGSDLKIEGGTFIPERFCDVGWPEPPVPTKG
jgi:hypothetical protein